VDLTEKTPHDEENISVYFFLLAALYLFILIFLAFLCYVQKYKRKEIKLALDSFTNFNFSKEVYRDLESAPGGDSEAPVPPLPPAEQRRNRRTKPSGTGLGLGASFAQVHPLTVDPDSLEGGHTLTLNQYSKTNPNVRKT